MFGKSAEVFPKVINDFASGKIKPQKQNHLDASFSITLEKEDGYFEIDTPPNEEKLNRMIRAYYPWPGVWTKWNNKIVKFLPSFRHSERSEESKYLLQMEGKNPITLKEFLNGHADFPLKDI